MYASLNKIFLILFGYQLTWLFCVFGEYYEVPLLGCVVGVFYLIIFFYFNNNRITAFRICLIYSLIGFLFDSFLGFNKLYTINSKIMFGYLPIWFLVLWPSFTTLLVEVLTFLKNRFFIAFLLGATLAPSTYYFGIYLGIAKSNNLFFAMTIMLLFWGLLISSYSFYLRKY